MRVLGAAGSRLLAPPGLKNRPGTALISVKGQARPAVHGRVFRRVAPPLLNRNPKFAVARKISRWLPSLDGGMAPSTGVALAHDRPWGPTAR